jgi:hypothetical protein
LNKEDIKISIIDNRVVFDESLEDIANLPDPDLLAKEIVEDLETALEQFTAIQEVLE